MQCQDFGECGGVSLYQQRPRTVLTFREEHKYSAPHASHFLSKCWLGICWFNNQSFSPKNRPSSQFLPTQRDLSLLLIDILWLCFPTTWLDIMKVCDWFRCVHNPCRLKIDSLLKVVETTAKNYLHLISESHFDWFPAALQCACFKVVSCFLIGRHLSGFCW